MRPGARLPVPIVPAPALGVNILIVHIFRVMFRVAGSLGMMDAITSALTIGAYRPISDNAGGAAKAAERPERARGPTGCLDAAGISTKAIGNGFVNMHIGSATFLSLAFGAVTVRAKALSRTS